MKNRAPKHTYKRVVINRRHHMSAEVVARHFNLLNEDCKRISSWITVYCLLFCPLYQS